MVYNVPSNSVTEIWVAWNRKILEGKLLHVNDQWITCSLKPLGPQEEPFILYVVYGSNKRNNKRDLRRKLRYHLQLYGNKPWLVKGDFNTTLDVRWKIGKKKIDRSAVKDFTDWISDMDMVCMSSRGFKYIWSNNRANDQVVCPKIDHMLCE